MILLAVFFAPAIPMGLLITAVGLVYFYCTSRYCMLRHSRYPPRLGMEVSLMLVEMLEFVPLIYAISNYCFVKLIG